MSTRGIVLASIVGTLTAFASAVFAIDATPKTLEQCASLLPSGRTYSFLLSGTVDTTQGEPVLRGEFSMDDGTQVDRRDESEAFAKCLSALIK